MIREQEDKIVEQILNSPKAVMYANQVNDILEAEQQKRNQFYNDITDYEKAEFINGEIVIHSPVKKEHNDVAGNLFQLLAAHVKRKELGYIGYEKIMINLTRNDYEPDICFFNKEKSVKFEEGQSLFPAPDLVIEILSKGTSANDRGVKFYDYEAHEIEEYWIIQPKKKFVEQYRLDKNGKYELILKSGTGTINCQPVKGFQFEIEAIFDDAVNLKELTRILTT